MLNKLKNLLVLFWKDEGGWIAAAIAMAPAIFNALGGDKKKGGKQGGAGDSALTSLANAGQGQKAPAQPAAEGGGGAGGEGGIQGMAKGAGATKKFVGAISHQYLAGKKAEAEQYTATVESQSKKLDDVRGTLGSQSKQRASAISGMQAGFMHALQRGRG